MSATIKTKIRTTTGGTPSTTAGELCVNTADKKIHIGTGAASVELANQIGYNTITTLGTISTGTWSATAIGATKGGTGQTTYATGDLIYSSASDTLSKLTKPAATSVLSMSSGGVPSWIGVTGTGSVPLSNSPVFDIGFNVQDTVGSQGAIIGFVGKDQFSSPAEYWGVYFGALGTPQIPFTMYDYNDSTTYFQINGDKSIVIGDVGDAYDSTRITVNASGLSVDITGTLNINGYNVFPLSSVVIAATALTNSSTAQSAFSVGQQTLTVSQNTTYLIEGEYIINSGTTTHTTAIGFTVAGDIIDATGLEFSVVLWSAAASTITTSQSSIHVTANANTQTVLNAGSTAAVTTIQIKGIWNNTSNETITPKIKFSAAPGGTNQMAAGSYIRFTPVTNPTVGSWA